MKKEIDSNKVNTNITPQIRTLGNNLKVIDESGKLEEMTALITQLRASGELDIFEERERKRKEEYEKAQKES
ncbi:hypothetical protein [Myroides profundi]|uniref:hypothetical protein n=1 Tax=Myroides profundi TaxID=480520 RepID=UPI0005A33702|nr:hypothetical protein [Myroides profundi]AJH13222.1 hypothetical protein MPR_0002 [Myroides profundi]